VSRGIGSKRQSAAAAISSRVAAPAFSRIEDIILDALVRPDSPPRSRMSRDRLRPLLAQARRVNRLFLFVVIIPTTLAILYFGLIAHDVYVSESHFVVRSPQRQMTTGIGTLLQGTGLSQASDDVYSVQDFLSSRDALQELEQQFHLKQSFGSGGVDWFSRFGALDGDQSFEALLRYFRKRIVNADLDSTSSIITLTVRAFSAEQAYQINEALLKMSEAFVNGLNERSREDLIRFAAQDVQDAERQAKTAVLAVSNYRNQKSVFDPERQSGLQLEQVGKLQEELIATRNELAGVRAVAKNNPQIPVLQNRAEVLREQIDAETAKVAGSGQSLSSKSAEYEGVVLERAFAAKRLEIALTSLLQARESAMKQQLYLERIDRPNRPDVAIEPKRARNIAATLMLCLIVWGVVSLLVTAVKEHAD
jgi:capsular polysaccharide transport system permease protein